MSKQNLLPLLLILCVGFGVYANSLKNEFVWDDEFLIVKNPAIKDVKYIKDIFSKGYLFSFDIESVKLKYGSQFYRPIQALSYFLDYLVWGKYAPGFRFTNILIHVLNTILIFLIIGKIGRFRWAALLIALFFCAHPAFTAAVSYIAGRADILFFCFSMLSYYFYLCYIFEKKKGAYYVSSLLFFLLGLLSKEMSVFILFLFFITSALFKDRIAIKPNKHALVFLGYIFVALVYFSIRNAAVGSSVNTVLTSDFNFYERLLVSVYFFMEYIGILFFPISLYMERTFHLYSFFNGPFLSAYAVLICFGCLMYIAGRSPNKTAFFGGLWFFFSFLMISNIFIPLNASMAEHWLYLPSVGFFIFLIFLIKDLVLRNIPANSSKSIRIALIILVAIYLSLFSIRTILRNRDWRNEETLFNQTAKASVSSSRAMRNLSAVYASKGDFNKALEIINQAIRINPKIADNYINRSALYRKLNSLDQSVADLEAYLTLKPDDAMAYSDLGSTYEIKGDIDKAVYCWKKAVEINPNMDYARGKVDFYKR